MDKESAALLPNHFYISGVPKKRKIPKLFRPKELAQYIFPDLGMIMYDLFWIKYTLFLVGDNYIPWMQDRLFFWASRGKDIDPLKSVIFFSLKSKIHSLLGDSGDIPAGRRFARDWLFTGIGDWREIVALKLMEFSKRRQQFDFKEFVDIVFSSSFKERCSNDGIKLPAIASKLMNEYFEKSSCSSKYDSAVEAFCKFLSYVLHERNILRYYPTRIGAVVDPNIDFARDILLFNKTELNGLSEIANTNFRITKREVLILLERLTKSELGRNLLASIVLVSYYDPLNNANPTIVKLLRNSFDLYQDATDFEVRVRSVFGDFEIPKNIFDNMNETCFSWEFNFFLTDGETIARKIIQDEKIISSQNVIEYFSVKKPIVEYFMHFIETLPKPERIGQFQTLINKHQETKDTVTIDFLNGLLKSIKTRQNAHEIFEDLLETRGTLEKKSPKIFIVTGAVSKKESSEALFYGVDALIRWTKTILRVLKDAN